MNKNLTTWCGAVSGGNVACDKCGGFAFLLFPLEPSGWCVCQACILNPAHSIAVIDRRGDALQTRERIACELDLRTAIALHCEAQADCGQIPKSPSLPADYLHALAVLGRLARADDEFGSAISEMRERYEAAACFSPKQMLLVQWRLVKCDIQHEPSSFAVSTRSEKEIAQIRSLSNWQQRKLAPYLSWQQRSKFGF
jgi:hypothetical protein